MVSSEETARIKAALGQFYNPFKRKRKCQRIDIYWLILVVDYSEKLSNFLEDLRKVKEFIKSIGSDISK